MRSRTRVRWLLGLVGVTPLVLLLVGGAGWAFAADRACSFTILHVTDTHLCKLEGYNDQLVKKREHFGRGYDPLCQLLGAVPGERVVDAVVITGDLVDFYEGEAADGTLRAGQIEYFATLLPLVKVPLWMTLGNHDIQTHANRSHAVAKNGGRATGNLHAGSARAAWIRHAECFRQGTYYAREVRVGKTLWKLYFLDNGYQVTSSDSRATEWGVPQLEWLSNELRQPPDQKAILFFHIPLSANSPPAPAEAPLSIHKVLDDHPCVVATFCGHGHKNLVFEKIKLPGGHAVSQIETAGFGYDRNAWRTIKLREDAVIVSRAGSSETEVVIEAGALPQGVVPLPTTSNVEMPATLPH